MGVDAYTTHYQDIWVYGHANGKGQESILGVWGDEDTILFALTEEGKHCGQFRTIRGEKSSRKSK